MKRSITLLVVVLGICFSGFCVSEEKGGWDAFDLGCLRMNGASLYYERSLEPKLPFVRACYARFAAEQAEEMKRKAELAEKADEILPDVNRIVGARLDDAGVQEQRSLFDALLRLKMRLGDADGKLRLYLVTKETIKDFLRKGGSLPNFSYDKATDTASYALFARFSSKEAQRNEEGGSAAIEELAIPVAGGEAFEQEVRGVFSAFSTLFTAGGERPGMLFHEVAEWTMVNVRLRPYDAHFRWFSDGFANAITARLLKKYVSEDAAKEFVAEENPKEYSDVEKEVNLQYWMGSDFCIETPLGSEGRLGKARYAFATLEAERLIEKYGIECVGKILDKACKEPRNSSRNLVAAVKEVTGEDVEQRLRQYQTFATREEGLEKYRRQFGEAMSNKDYAAALSSLLRAQELIGGRSVENYYAAAQLLAAMGQEGAGDRVITSQLQYLKSRGLVEAHEALQKLFVEYALKCRNPKKAYETAEEVLKAEPGFVAALAVRMDRLRASGDLTGAKELARHIVELEKDSGSAAYKLAQEVLSLDEMK